MKKTIFIIALTAVLAASGGFYGGTLYSKSKKVAFGNLSEEDRRQQFQQMGTAQIGGGNERARIGSGTSGEIISKDDESITVKLANGGSKIVFVSAATEIMKTTVGTADDLSVGKTIIVTGDANSDGSISAKTIQAR